MPPRETIFDRRREGVAQVQRTGNIGRRDDLCGHRPVSQVISTPSTRRVPRYLGAAALVSAQTRTRRASDALDRVERAAPRSDHATPEIEGRLNLISTQAG